MQLSNINSLRGIAILMVIMVHVSQLFKFSTKFEMLFFDYGKMGVQLFFIASAYTLCLSDDNRKKEEKHLLKFYIRRYFRIFPIYYLGIILYFALNYYQGSASSYTLKNVMSNVLFTHGLVPSANNSIVPGGWSIGAEMLFYLIFPFLFKFLKYGYRIIKAAILIIIGQTLVFLGTKKLGWPIDFSYFCIFNQLSVFVTGILFYIYRNKFNNLPIAITGFIIFTTVTFSLAYFDIANSYKIIPFSSALSFCCLFVISTKTLLINNKLFQEIGINSYSIYVVHFILPFFVLPKMNGYPMFIGSFILVVLCSYLISVFLNKVIERPFIEVGKQIIKIVDLENKLHQNNK